MPEAYQPSLNGGGISLTLNVPEAHKPAACT